MAQKLDTMQKVDKLRLAVALKRYEADAHDIAEAMLRQLTPVNFGPIAPSDSEIEALLFADEPATLRRAS